MVLFGDFNIMFDEIEVIEVIGGSMCVFGVKEEIGKVINGRKFDVYFDVDEVVVMGVGFFVVNMFIMFCM